MPLKGKLNNTWHVNQQTKTPVIIPADNPTQVLSPRIFFFPNLIPKKEASGSTKTKKYIDVTARHSV